jgi:hypothetical protein
VRGAISNGRPYRDSYFVSFGRPVNFGIADNLEVGGIVYSML